MENAGFDSLMIKYGCFRLVFIGFPGLLRILATPFQSYKHQKYKFIDNPPPPNVPLKKHRCWIEDLISGWRFGWRFWSWLRFLDLVTSSATIRSLWDVSGARLPGWWSEGRSNLLMPLMPHVPCWLLFLMLIFLKQKSMQHSFWVLVSNCCRFSKIKYLKDCPYTSATCLYMYIIIYVSWPLSLLGLPLETRGATRYFWYLCHKRLDLADMSGKLKKTRDFQRPPGRSVVISLGCKGGWLGGLLLRSVFLYLTMNFCVTLGDVASICFLGGAGSRKNQNKKPDLNHDQEGSFNPGSWLHGFQNLFSKQNWCWHSSRPNKMRV